MLSLAALAAAWGPAGTGFAAETNIVLVKEASSREVSISVGAARTPAYPEAISREVSLFVGATATPAYAQSYSREVSVLVSTPAVPERIATLTVDISPAGDSATLDWGGYSEPTQRDVLRYDIYVSDQPFSDVSAMTAYTSVAAGVSSIFLDGLPPWQDRYFAVVAVDALGGFDPVVEYAAGYVLAPQAISREVSLFVGAEETPSYAQVSSREVSVLVSTPSVPEAVTTLNVLATPGGDSATLDWSGYSEPTQHDVVRYDIYMSGQAFSDVTGMTPYTNVSPGTFAITLDGLPPWRDHYFAVVAVDALGGFNPIVQYRAAYVLAKEAISREVSLSVGAGDTPTYQYAFSREVSVLVPDAAAPDPVTYPQCPFSAEASVSAYGALDLDWSYYEEGAQRDVARYRIYASQNGHYSNVSGMEPFAYVPAGTKRFTLTGLTGGEIYFVTVVAEDALRNWNPNVASSEAQASQGGLGEARDLAVACYSNTLRFTWQPPNVGSNFLESFRAYLGEPGETPAPITLAKTTTVYEATGLLSAHGYWFRLTTVDRFGNESSGVSLMGATLLPNPTNVTAVAFDRSARLDWDAVQPPELVKHYAVYQAQTPFNSVTGMTPRLTWQGTGGTVDVLTNGATYYFGVVAVNVSDGFDPTVSSVSVVPAPDIRGPTLSDARFAGDALTNGLVIRSPGSLSVRAQDKSEVDRVEFFVDDVLIGRDVSGARGYYSAHWNVTRADDGPRVVRIDGYDTLDNRAAISNGITVAFYSALPPTITGATWTPMTGDTSTVFTLEADVLHPDGMPVTGVVAVVSGETFAMPLVAGAASNGTFAISTSLSARVHTYHVVAVSENGQSTRYPAEGEAAGPHVHVPPVLDQPSFAPPSPTDKAPCRFEVRYADVDGDEPQRVELVLDGVPRRMAPTRGKAHTARYGWSGRLSPGVHTYAFRTTDAFGHSARLPASGEFSTPAVRNLPPVIALTIDPVATRVPHLDVELEADEPLVAAPLVSACDTNGTMYPVVAGPVVSNRYSFSADLTGMPEGDGILSFRATDLDGAGATGDGQFRYDLTPPVCEPSIANGQVAAGSNHVLVTPSEPLAGVPLMAARDRAGQPLPCTYAGRDSEAYAFTMVVDPATAAEGTGTVTVTAVDLAGHTGATHRTFVVDTGAPSLYVETPDYFGPGLHAVTARVDDALCEPPTLSVLDATGLPLRVYGPTSAGTSHTFRVYVARDTAEGDATLTARVTDPAGNAEQVTRTVRVDTTAPELTLVTVPSPPVSGSNLVIRVTTDEALRAAPELMASLDGVSPLPLPPPTVTGGVFTWACAFDEAAVFTASGTDLAGNVGETRLTYADVEVKPEDIRFSDLIGEGRVVIMTTRVSNVGAARVERVPVSVRARMPNTARVLLLDTNVTLAAGQAAELAVSWPTHAQGTAPVVEVLVDPDDRLLETNEANNLALRGVSAVRTFFSPATLIRGGAVRTAEALVYDSGSLRVLGDGDVNMSARVENAAETVVGGPWTATYATNTQRFQVTLDPAALLLPVGEYELVWDIEEAGGVHRLTRTDLLVIDDFTITLLADRAIYNRGEPVELSGEVRDTMGRPVSDAAVSLRMLARYGQREFRIVTENGGSYRYVYEPSLYEAADYAVTGTVVHAGIERTSAPVSFTILGLAMDGFSGTWNLYTGDTGTRPYRLRNTGEHDLTGVAASLERLGGTMNSGASLDDNGLPATLAPGETGDVRLIVPQLSEEGREGLRVVVRSDEGAEASCELELIVSAGNARLVFEPDFLETTTALDTPVTQEVVLRNLGGTNARDVVLSADNPDWISLHGVGAIGTLAATRGLADHGFGLYPHGSLLGRVGTNGPVFAVTNGTRRVATVTGEIQFRVNEADGAVANNGGALDVVCSGPMRDGFQHVLVDATAGWQTSGVDVITHEPIDFGVAGSWRPEPGVSRDADGRGVHVFSITWNPTNPALASAGVPADWAVRAASPGMADAIMPLRSWVSSDVNGTARFRVVDLLGAPLEGAEILLYATVFDPATQTYPEFTKLTDTNGVALFTDVVPGPYGYRIVLDEHRDELGTLDIARAQTTDIDVTLSPDLVGLEWVHHETEIEDRYDIVLRTTYKTYDGLQPPVLLISPIGRHIEPNHVEAGIIMLRNVGDFSARNVLLELPHLRDGARIVFTGSVGSLGGARVRQDRVVLPVLRPNGFVVVHYEIDLTRCPLYGTTLTDEMNVSYEYVFPETSSLGGAIVSEEMQVPVTIMIASGETLILDPPFLTVFDTHSLGLKETGFQDVGDVRVINPDSNLNTVTGIDGPEGAMLSLGFGILDLVGAAFEVAEKAIEFYEVITMQSRLGGDVLPSVIPPGHESTMHIRGMGIHGTMPFEADLVEVSVGAVWFFAEWDYPASYRSFHLLPIAIASVVDLGIDLPDDPDVGPGTGVTYPPWWYCGGCPPPRPIKDSGYVTFDIRQEATFDRQAFVAELRISNNSGTLPLDDLRVDIAIEDEYGVVIEADHREFATLFFRQPELAGLASVDGDASLATQSVGRAEWLIIPTREAGGNTYYLRANLSWNWGGAADHISSHATPITIAPQPFVHLDYFIQPAFHANTPFFLGALASNVGEGPAKNLRILSHPPELAFVGDWENASVTTVGSAGAHGNYGENMVLDFGTLGPGEDGFGYWVLQARPAGRVTSFQVAELTHDGALGGESTSLLDASASIHWVRRHGLLDDRRQTTPSLLLADSDRNGVPDGLFDTDQPLHEPVTAFTAEAQSTPAPTSTAFTITVPSHSGWAYIETADVLAGTKPVAAIRAIPGGRTLSPHNYWVEAGTIHFVDYDASTYEVIYELPPESYAATGTLALDARRYRRYGATATARVEDDDADITPGTGNDTVSVRVTSTSDPTGETVTLQETALAGTFTGNFGFASNVVSGDGKLGITNGESFDVVYSDVLGDGAAAADVEISAEWMDNTRPYVQAAAPLRVTISEDGSPVPFRELVNAVDGESDPLRWKIASPGSHGTADVSPFGNSVTLTYQPDRDWHGSDAFQLEVEDSFNALDTRRVEVTVTAVNDPPENVSLPLVTGIQRVGDTLTALPGTWTDERDTNFGGSSTIAYEFAWQRIGGPGRGSGGLETITGAGTNTYALTASDKFRHVRAVVTAVDDGVGGPESASATMPTPWVFVGTTDPDIYRIDAPRSAGRGVEIYWYGIAGRDYQVQRADRPEGPWTDAPSGLDAGQQSHVRPAADGLVSYEDVTHGASRAAFYRIVMTVEP